MSGRPWTPSEDALMREQYGRTILHGLRRLLGRSARAVYQRAVFLNLHERRRLVSDSDRETIRRMHAEGCVDAQIAAELGWSRECVGVHRRKMGLPSHIWGESHRRKLAEATARQLQRAGLNSTSEIRREAFRAYARESGWPEGLRPRAVQILNLLASVGVPLSRRQIAEGIGLPWRGSRQSLKSGGKRGTYLADLCASGLVQLLPQAGRVTGRGKGRSCHLYCLSGEALAILARRAGRS